MRRGGVGWASKLTDVLRKVTVDGVAGKRKNKVCLIFT